MTTTDNWQHRAACRGLDPDLFFPEVGSTGTEARAVCNTCPVRAQCLDDAINRDEKFGIWGGMAHLERRAETRRRGGRTREREITHGTLAGHRTRSKQPDGPCPICRDAAARYRNPEQIPAGGTPALTPGFTTIAQRLRQVS